MEYQYAKKFFIGYSDVDKNNKCKLSKIVDLLQNTATMHSKAVGYGTKEMMERKEAWLMLGWKVRIIKYPEADMDVEVRTWSRGVKGIEAKRGYEILSEDGEILIIADSTWALFDLENQKLIRASEEMKNAYGAIERNPFENEKIERLRDNEIVENEISMAVGKRDIDTNNHMNNSRYMEYIVEVLPDSFVVTEFESAYKKQVGYGENIKISYGESMCRIKNANNETAFLVKLHTTHTGTSLKSANEINLKI